MIRDRPLRHLVQVPLALLGVGLAAETGYLAALSVAALTPTPPVSGPAPRARLVVLVPAHDEEVLIGRCLQHLLAQDHPAELRRIVVVADNCTDRTAELARELLAFAGDGELDEAAAAKVAA